MRRKRVKKSPNARLHVAQKAELAELDDLDNASQSRVKRALNDMVKRRFKDVFTTGEEDITAVKAALEGGIPPSDTDADLAGAVGRLLASSLLLGMAHTSGALYAADAPADIPPIPFEEAVDFLRSKVPVTKAEWLALEPKLRFRAFTVAALTQADYIDTVKNLLADAVERGEGAAETWETVKRIRTLVNDGNAFDLKPGYWETVYRTNTQTAYNAGKRLQFDKAPPDSLRMLVVEDDRTTDICRPLDGLTLPYDDPFWDTHWPPLHFNCRSTVRGIYKAMGIPDTAPEKAAGTADGFKPAKGFGGNPVDKESWWTLTEPMLERARDYGILENIERFAKKNGLHNFTPALAGRAAMARLQQTPYSAHKAVRAQPSQKELTAAKILEENGHSVFFSPENKASPRIKNPEGIVDGRVAEFKVLTSTDINKIGKRIAECDTQGASIACIQVPTSAYSRNEAIARAKERLNSIEKPFNFVDTVYLIWGNTVVVIKK
jgi:SPP1 gp7 family putative phage head morphogenesis protein